MDIKDFWDMCEYANTAWRGKFSNREICENAYELYTNLLDGVSSGDPLDEFIQQLVMDWYEDDGGDLEHQLGDWLESLAYSLGYRDFDELIKDYAIHKA